MVQTYSTQTIYLCNHNLALQNWLCWAFRFSSDNMTKTIFSWHNYTLRCRSVSACVVHYFSVQTIWRPPSLWLKFKTKKGKNNSHPGIYQGDSKNGQPINNVNALKHSFIYTFTSSSFRFTFRSFFSRILSQLYRPQEFWNALLSCFISKNLSLPAVRYNELHNWFRIPKTDHWVALASFALATNFALVWNLLFSPLSSQITIPLLLQSIVLFSSLTYKMQRIEEMTNTNKNRIVICYRQKRPK